MAWEDVEELVIYWLVEANLGAWADLTETEEELAEVRRLDCECGSCRRVFLAMGAELQELRDDVALELLPELRLCAVKRIARKMQRSEFGYFGVSAARGRGFSKKC